MLITTSLSKGHAPRLAIAFLPLALAGCGAAPDTREPVSRTLHQVAAPLTGEACREAGVTELSASGAQFAPLSDRYYGAGCQALDSVQLDRVGGDPTRLL